MKLLPLLSLAYWTVVATQVFEGQFDADWTWKCGHRESAAIIARIRDGRLISAQRKIGRGQYELVVLIPKNSPRPEPQEAPEPPVASNRPRHTTDYEKLLQEA